MRTWRVLVIIRSDDTMVRRTLERIVDDAIGSEPMIEVEDVIATELAEKGK